MKIILYAKELINRYEVVRFIMVGGVATIIHYGIYWLLISTTDILYNIAYIIGYSVSITFNFFASNLFTFSTKPTLARAVKFGAGHGLNFLIELSVFNIALWFSVDPRFAPIVAFLVAFPINFVLIRFLLKGKRSSS